MRSEAMAGCVATVWLLLTPAPVRAQQTPDPAAAAKGQVTYGRYCVSCHGQTARGDGPLANDLRVSVPDLTTMATRNAGQYPYDRVLKILENGGMVRGHGSTDMPAWGDAFKKTKGTEEATVAAAIRDLANYVWSIQRPAR